MSHATGTFPRIVNGGARQGARRPEALSPGFAPVDGRSFAELLRFGARFAELIHFYDLDDRPQGDWTEFFVGDPTIGLSVMAAFDASRLEQAYREQARRAAACRSFADRFEALRSAFGVVHGFACRLDDALRGLGRGTHGAATRLLRRALEDALERGLGRELQRLRAYDAGAAHADALGRPVGLDWSGFAPAWGLAETRPDSSIYRGGTLERRIDRALSAVEPVASAFADRGAELARAAAVHLPATLEAADHPPQAALYIAFVKLFAHAQDSVNSVATRYAHFYYRRVLREPRAGAVPDSVYLAFTLADEEGVTETRVPPGTLFPAGEDAGGREILFAADGGLLVGAARLARLLTLRVVPGPLVVPTPAAEADEGSLPVVPQRVLGSEIEVEPEPVAANEAWPTFGPAQPGRGPVSETTAASLGFAVASWCLLLTSGRREVSLTVEYTTAFRDEVLEPLLVAAAAATGLAPLEVWRAVLEQAFLLEGTTASGWFPIAGYTVTLPPAETRPQPPWFRLQFSLPASAPPLEAMSDESKGQAAPAPLPALKAEVQPRPAQLPRGAGAVYPYSLLGRMAIDRVRVGVGVEGLGGLEIENTDGPVDPGTPFAVFGGVPAVGSYLRVKQRELFVKTPDSLRLALDWYGLPSNETGFFGWYKDYTLGEDGLPPKDPPLFDNGTFEATVGVRDPGAWWLAAAEDCPPPDGPEPPVVRFDLFEAKPPGGGCTSAAQAPRGSLCPQTRLDDLRVCRRPREPDYYDAGRSALEVRLTAPAYAFGADLYSINVLNAVIEDLPDTSTCEDQCLAECSVLQVAADKVAAGLEPCAALEDPFYLECARPRLRALETELAALCVDALLDCALPERSAGALAAELRASLDARPDERVERLRRCVEAVRAFWNTGGEARVCLARCLALFEALLAVVLADATCTDKLCVTKVLGVAEQRLRQGYGECLAACMAACVKVKKPLRYPNEPFLPQLTGLQVDYTAHADVPGAAQYFHLTPFGGWTAVTAAPALPLLPPLPDAGTLYLGFTSLTPPGSLSLLFEMAETGGPEAAPLPPVRWAYLAGDDWHALEGEAITGDSTRGLERSGIVSLALPAYDPARSTAFPGDLQWLRAAVIERPGAFPETIAIRPHALRATWQAEASDGAHLATPLPPQTITSSVQDLPYVGAIDQPMESFGGRPPEDEAAFERRLGERLRHKGRAVLAWDYERLVLERFPSIDRVWTLPAATVPDVAPGHVVLVVVPRPSGATPSDPTAPRATRQTLGAIEDYLRSRVSPFVRVRVVNPVYVRVEVRALVAFVPGAEPGAAERRLDEDLVAYLSPGSARRADCAGGAGQAIEDDVAGFIQSRPYVETLERLRLRYRPRRTTVEWCLLTSARSHEIHAVGDGSGGARREWVVGARTRRKR